MSLLNKCCLLILFCVYCEAQIRKEALMTVPNLIKAAGYPVEKHRVTTEDGYVLQMHRIPAGRRSARRTSVPSGKGKKAVLIVHGFFGSSSDFVLMGPERSLAYLLADAGYDVWLGNIRGTVYSTHKNLTRSNPKFWDYSFHEHGKYDVPAMIDGVLQVTGQNKIMYIGYSMGTTSFFITLSLRPEYNEKVMSFVAMAPAVYMDNIRPMANLAINTLRLPSLMRSRGMPSIEPYIVQSLSSICNTKQPENDICTNIIFAFIGEDYEQNDFEMMPVYMYRVQPGSLKQLEHFCKVALSGEFTMFTGGVSGPVIPYNLTNIRIPVSLLYGKNDQLTEKSQVMRLAEKLNSIGMLEDVRPGSAWPKFNHLDFVYAKDVGTIFNIPLVSYIDELYNKYNTV